MNLITLKIPRFHRMTPRGGGVWFHHKLVMLVTGFSDDGPPQMVFGRVICLLTGSQWEVLPGETKHAVFAGEIGAELTPREVDQFRRELHEKVDTFFNTTPVRA